MPSPAQRVGLLMAVVALRLATSSDVLPQSAEPRTTANLAVYDSLAASCIESMDDTLRSVRLSVEPSGLFLRPGLISALRGRGVELFLDEAMGVEAPTLRVATDAATVRYDRSSRSRWERSIELDLRFLLSDGGGRILGEDRCDRRYRDTVPAGRLDRLEHAGIPETQGVPPEAGPAKRWLEPALFTAAIGMVVYLFFTVRSGRDE